MKKYFGLIFFFLVTVSFGGDKEEKILKALQNKFETINDLTVDIIQKAGGKEILSGKLSFKKENKYNLDLKNILIISDGISIWNFNKKENKVIINNVDESDPSFFSFNTFVYDYPSQCIITSEQNGEVLVLTPKENSDLNFSKARLWINKENLITKIIFEGTGSGDSEVVFANYKLNKNITDSKFKFSPPEGSTIIDLR